MGQTTINNGDSGLTVRTALNTMFGELYASGYYIEVANYSALPAAASHTGEIYVCLADEGTWILGTKKAAGLWYSNGSSWSRLGPALNAAAIYFSAAGGVAGTDVQAAIEELDTEKLAKTGGTLTDVRESIAYEELTADKTISFASADVLYFYVNPAGASVALTMPSDPGALSKSGILWIKNNTSKAHTWVTTPAIRFVSETDADTVPTPAADGYYTRYTCQWHDNNGGTGFWAIGLAGKDTA